MTLTNSTYLFGVSPFIVGQVIGPATYTTISSAVAAATATGMNQTIYIQPGTYVESISWPANLTVIGCSSLDSPNVIIVGQQTVVQDGGAISFSWVSFTSSSTVQPTFVVHGTSNIDSLYVRFDNCTLDYLGVNPIAVLTSLGDAEQSFVTLTSCTLTGNSDVILLSSRSTADVSSSEMTSGGSGVVAKVGNNSILNVSRSKINSDVGSCISINSPTASIRSLNSSYFSNSGLAFSYSALGTVSSMYDNITVGGSYIANGPAGLLRYSFMTIPGAATSFAPTITAIPYFVLPVSTGLVWTSVSSSITLANNTGYFVTGGAVVLTLPAVSIVGDQIEIVLTTGTSWTLALSAGQRVRLGQFTTTLGPTGSLFAGTKGDSVSLVCDANNTDWVCHSSQGNILLN